MSNQPLTTATIRLDLSKPRYDQSTFTGRARHFFEVTDPRNLLVSSDRLETANQIVIKYKKGDSLPGLTEDDIWEAKRLADSAYHPETGEKMFLLGRMSAQVPCNMTITGLMMTFYKHPAAVVFWQWFNQSFNAIVNFTNNSGEEPVTKQELMVPYVAATSCATATAVGLNILTKNLPPLIGRFVPFAAVAAANCINIPLMRQREIKNGITITDREGNKIGTSKNAAKKAIGQVAVSRITMAMPAMVIPAIIMNSLDKTRFFKRLPWATAPLQVTLVGLCLTFSTPLCCAIFSQQSSIKVSGLEPEVRAQIQTSSPGLNEVYYNKGL